MENTKDYTTLQFVLIMFTLFSFMSVWILLFIIIGGILL